MAKLKDVVASVGKYTNSAGEEKTKFVNCGSLIESNGKQYIVMEVIPAPTVGKDGSSKWWFSLFDPKPRAGQDKPSKPIVRVAEDELNDSIPF